MSKISKDKLMKDLFKFPNETLMFLKEVARVNEDMLLENTIDRILNSSDIAYDMISLSQERTSNKNENGLKRLDLALEFRTVDEQIEFILFIENQTSNDKNMVLRMIEYVTATLMEKLQSKSYDMTKGLPRPIPVLIYLASDSCTMSISLEDYFKVPKMANRGLEFSTYLVDLGGKEYQQVLSNLSTPGIFLQLMKAILTTDNDALYKQIKILKEELNTKNNEVRRFFESKLEMLVSDFVSFVVQDRDYSKSEVEELTLTLKEIQQITGADALIRASLEGKVSVIVDMYNKYRDIENIRNDCYSQLLQVFEEYDLSEDERQQYLKELK